MSQYDIYLTPRAWREVKVLPSHMRQRLRREIDGLAAAPRPSTSKALDVPPPGGDEEPRSYELRRLRIDRWRIAYAVTEEAKIIDVLTIQKRPPYDYGDLSDLMQELK
ncbi:type II toxin-antitoxin system RelE/ParE family toxin [Candidatus Chloroploca sp. Khr17]|uniref:type II toxin-antitoxin system RelE family toxin n=1 Tax=Candidatus Chloroploca sp. Khr17 TaxID=2496869 RepID=UPI00101DF976|nr:type II toxin-antitoxin system RelE/ParE family toxin [Candidatus Chloroploca sp. Khr17]